MKGWFLLVLAVICVGCEDRSRPAKEDLADMEIPSGFLETLHNAGAKGESWTQSAIEVSLHMQNLTTWETTEPSFNLAVEFISKLGQVSLHARGIPDDSLYELFSVITLRRDEKAGYWIPISMRSCWKGRGLDGWSTDPPL